MLEAHYGCTATFKSLADHSLARRYEESDVSGDEEGSEEEEEEEVEEEEEAPEEDGKTSDSIAYASTRRIS